MPTQSTVPLEAAPVILSPVNMRWRGIDISPDAIRNALLLLLVAWILVSSAYSAAISPKSGITGLDFDIFYQAAHRLNVGEVLYQPHLAASVHKGRYVYSPLPALLLRPLAYLPFSIATKLWFFINAGSLIAAVLLYGGAARMNRRTLPQLVVLLLVTFRFWDTTMNLGLGQANALMLALIGGMLWADSRKRWVLMAGLIALAALFKIWLIGLALYLLLRRRWKESGLAVGLLLVALAALFTLVGWSSFLDFVSSMAQSKADVEGYTVMNSIIGFADLHLRRNLIVSPLSDSKFGYAAFIAICLAAVIWGLATLQRVLASPSPLEERLSFSLVLATILLLLPTYENGYLVYCFPLLWTLLASSDADGKRHVNASRLMLIGGILAYIIFSRAWPVYAPFPAATQHGFHSLIVSMNFYATTAFWGLGFAALLRLRPPAFAQRPALKVPVPNLTPPSISRLAHADSARQESEHRATAKI